MTKKHYYHLTQWQRYKIEALIKAGHKAPFISVQLKVSPSTIYRELKRNKTKTGKYNAAFAQELSVE
ncbi:MAG: helix-turn-helix domain-containing protein, partial [Bacteroidetes bacterium]|nr:helix-turn-helix domain-containing protein [Bacteroidota bacterium]